MPELEGQGGGGEWNVNLHAPPPTPNSNSSTLQLDLPTPTTYSLLYASSMAASTIVRFAFENARPTRVSVLPLPANLSA